MHLGRSEASFGLRRSIFGRLLVVHVLEVAALQALYVQAVAVSATDYTSGDAPWARSKHDHSLILPLS